MKKHVWTIGMALMVGLSFFGRGFAAKGPVIKCPKGSVVRGQQPPRGFELRCVRQIKNKKGQIAKTIQAGPTIAYYKSGKVWRRGHYRNNKRHGTWIRYWNNGRKQQETTYKSGVPVGTYRYFRSNGKVWQQGLYKGGKRYGKVYYYLTRDRAPIVCQIKSEKTVGCQSKHKNGKLKYRLKFTSSSGSGQEELYYSDGKLFAKRKLVKKLPQGVVKVFHDNGKRGLEVNCQRGRFSQPKEWSEKGKVLPPRLAKRLGSSLCTSLEREVDLIANRLLISYFPSF